MLFLRTDIINVHACPACRGHARRFAVVCFISQTTLILKVSPSHKELSVVNFKIIIIKKRLHFCRCLCIHSNMHNRESYHHNLNIYLQLDSFLRLFNNIHSCSCELIFSLLLTNETTVCSHNLLPITQTSEKWYGTCYKICSLDFTLETLLIQNFYIKFPRGMKLILTMRCSIFICKRS